MANPLKDELKQKLRGIYRGFVATIRGIRREERTDVKTTIGVIDQKHVEDVKTKIQKL